MFGAGKDWLTAFRNSHPRMSLRKSQNLNEARAQKLNPVIVNDYFEKLKSLLLELDIIDEPQTIFNMDEKGIGLCLHRSPLVLAQKGTKRIHYRGKEHGEKMQQ